MFFERDAHTHTQYFFIIIMMTSRERFSDRHTYCYVKMDKIIIETEPVKIKFMRKKMHSNLKLKVNRLSRRVQKFKVETVNPKLSIYL